jgi:hypothetical protein
MYRRGVQILLSKRKQARVMRVTRFDCSSVLLIKAVYDIDGTARLGTMGVKSLSIKLAGHENHEQNKGVANRQNFGDGPKAARGLYIAIAATSRCVVHKRIICRVKFVMTAEQQEQGDQIGGMG